MRRRLSLTIVGVVAAALAVAGLGTLLLARTAARAETRDDLVEQAQALAGLVDGLEGRPVLAALRRSLRLEGAEVVALPGPRAARRPALAAPPAGAFELAPADVARLQAGTAVSGWRGDVAYAAAPLRRGPVPRAAVVLTRRQASGLGVALPWFVVSALAALGAAAVAADRLARRFARPLTAAEQATRRIAAGDLGVRVDPGGPGAEAELARLAGSINSMAADLERARGLERQFLLSVSHELRTPLTSVRGFAEAIADGAAPDDRRAAEIIGAEARRLERLVGDLLDLAKLDARAFSLDVVPVDAAEVVADTAEGFRPAAEAAGVALDVEAMDPGLVVAADPERLAQVVANLVENALKFATSRISVAAGRDGDRVVVTVCDDGPGIPDADLPHLFDRLFQSSRRPARQVGSGLGLAIVAELGAAMGAVVAAESRPGATRMVVGLRGSSASSSAAPASSSWPSTADGSS
ncbi:MAG: sensor histidine kinase [Actinomycetota bacterium]